MATTVNNFREEINYWRNSPDPRSIERLCQFFKHKNWILRKEAAEALIERGDSVIQPLTMKIFSEDIDEDSLYWCIKVLGKFKMAVPTCLIPLLSNENIPNRYKHFVLEEIGKFKDPGHIPLLINFLSHEDWKLRNKAADILINYGDKAVSFVKSGFTSGNEDIRYWSVKILGRILGKDAIAFFKNLQTHSKKEFRYYAVTALAQIDSEDAQEALVDSFLDDSWLVRAQVAETLEKLGKRSIRYLKQIFKKGSSDIKFQVIKLMGKILEEESEAFIQSIISSEDTELKFYAIAALADRKVEASVKMIYQCFDDKVWLIRKHASETLATMPAKLVLPVLTEKFNQLSPGEENEDRRYWIINTLGRLGLEGFQTLYEIFPESGKKEKLNIIEAVKGHFEPGVLNFLIRALSDENWPVRRQATTALTEYGSTGLPAIMERLDDENSDIRYWLSIAVQEMEPRILDELKDLFNNPDSIDERERAMKMLLYLGTPRAVEIILKYFKEVNITTRQELVDQFVQVDNPRLIESILALLGMESDDVNLWLCQILSKFDQKYSDVYIGAMRVADKQKLKWIIKLLGEHSPEAGMIEMLPMLGHDDTEIVQEIIKSIKKLNETELCNLIYSNAYELEFEKQEAFLDGLKSIVSEKLFDKLIAKLKTASDAKLKFLVKTMARSGKNKRLYFEKKYLEEKDQRVKTELKKVVDHIKGINHIR